MEEIKQIKAKTKEKPNKSLSRLQVGILFLNNINSVLFMKEGCEAYVKSC